MSSKPQDMTAVVEQTVPASRMYVRRIRARCESGWKVAEYSSLYLAVIAMIEVYVAMTLLSLPASPAPLVVGLLTFAVYANDRLVDLQTDTTSSPRRTAFVSRHSRALYTAAALSYGLAVMLAVTGGPLVFGLTLLPGAVWVLYAVDWAPGVTASFERLKEVLVLNSVLVAATWSVTVVFVPVAFAHTTLSQTGGIVLLYLVLGTFVNTEIANVGDIESDRQNGVSTMPTAFGVDRTRRYLATVTVFMALVVGAAVASGALTVFAATALSTGVVSLLCVTLLVGRVDDSDQLTIAAEFTRLPVLLVLITPVLTG